MLNGDKNVNLKSDLNQDEMKQLRQGLARVDELCQFALHNGLILLIDAEYTYMNDGISVVALALMLKYNRENTVVVANTYQCYLKVL